MSYLVALLDPPSTLIKYPCTNGAEITDTVRRICEMIAWDPTTHYENFWETVGDTAPFDEGQVAFIDLWESDLIASLVIGRPEGVVEAAERFGRLVEADNE